MGFEGFYEMLVIGNGIMSKAISLGCLIEEIKKSF
jgi:hypothetical protein